MNLDVKEFKSEELAEALQCFDPYKMKFVVQGGQEVLVNVDTVSTKLSLANTEKLKPVPSKLRSGEELGLEHSEWCSKKLKNYIWESCDSHRSPAEPEWCQRVLLYLLAVFSAPTTKFHPTRELVVASTAFKNPRAYNWSKFVLDHLKKWVSNYKSAKDKKVLKERYLGGCVYILVMLLREEKRNIKRYGKQRVPPSVLQDEDLRILYEETLAKLNQATGKFIYELFERLQKQKSFGASSSIAAGATEDSEVENGSQEDTNDDEDEDDDENMNEHLSSFVHKDWRTRTTGKTVAASQAADPAVEGQSDVHKDPEDACPPLADEPAPIIEDPAIENSSEAAPRIEEHPDEPNDRCPPPIDEATPISQDQPPVLIPDQWTIVVYEVPEQGAPVETHEMKGLDEHTDSFEEGFATLSNEQIPQQSEGLLMPHKFNVLQDEDRFSTPSNQQIPQESEMLIMTHCVDTPQESYVRKRKRFHVSERMDDCYLSPQLDIPAQQDAELLWEFAMSKRRNESESIPKLSSESYKNYPNNYTKEEKLKPTEKVLRAEICKILKEVG